MTGGPGGIFRGYLAPTPHHQVPENPCCSVNCVPCETPDLVGARDRIHLLPGMPRYATTDMSQCPSTPSALAVTQCPAPSTSTDETEDDVDLFGDDFDPASMDLQEGVRERADFARREKLAQLPVPSQRTCTQNRMAYVLSGQRLQPTQTASVFTRQQCEHTIAAVVDFVQSHGGLHTERHEAFATTDVPVASLSLPWIRRPPDGAALSTGDALRQLVVEAVLLPLAEATGFPAHHLGLQDLFIVCYRAAHSTSEQLRMQYPIPSKQASLAIHSDGCLLSFSLLLNHHDAFQGGGTFFKRSGQTFQLEQGGLLVHDAGLERE